MVEFPITSQSPKIARYGTPYVTLLDEDGRIEGEYQIGVQSGTLNGYAHSDFIDFSFEDSDEREEAFGEGETTLDGDRLTFKLWKTMR